MVTASFLKVSLIMSRIEHLDGSIEYVLSPMDSIMTRFGLTILHIFPSLSTMSYDFKQLQLSLAECIAQDYPMLVGEQRMDPVTGIISVYQQAANQPYVVPFFMDESCTLDTSTAIATMSNSLMPPPRDRQQHVLSVKCTLLSDGGLAIGVDCSHCVLDGEGIFQFMKIWGMHYRSLSPQDRPRINHDRYLLNATGKGAMSPHPEFRVLPPQPPSASSDRLQQLPATTQHVFHLSPSWMQQLKAIVNQGPYEVEMSTMDAITALFTLLISQARKHGQPVKITTAVNARKRLEPPLPSYYAGNATFNALCSYSADEMNETTPKTLQLVAHRIRQSINQCTNSYLRDVIEFITSQPSTLISQVQANRDFFFGHDLLFSSWVHLGMYEANFGTTPWYCGPPTLPVCDGMVVIVEAQRNETGIDVLVLLETNAMDRLIRLWEQYCHDHLNKCVQVDPSFHATIQKRI